MKFLLGLISFFGFLALLASGAYLGYGVLIEDLNKKLDVEVQKVEESLPPLEQALVNEIHVENMFIAKNFSNLAFNLVFDKGIVSESKKYGSPLMNIKDFEEIESFDSTKYYEVSFIVKDNPETVKADAITFLVISLSTWIGFWILKKLA